MRKSWEHASKVTAVSASLAIGIGGPAVAQTMKHPKVEGTIATAKIAHPIIISRNAPPPIKPSVRQVASRIKAIVRRGAPAKGGPGEVSFQQVLFDNEVAAVTLRSATSDVSGLPALDTVEEIDVAINRAQDPAKPYVSTLESVEMIRKADGSWNMYESDVTADSFPDLVHHYDVVGRAGHKYTKEYDSLILDEHYFVSPPHIVGGPADAQRMKLSDEYSANNTLDTIVRAQHRTK